MKLTVLIPTYCRSADLQECLQGLLCQERPAEEVLIVTRPEDRETAEALAAYGAWPELRVVKTDRAGQVNALNVGLSSSTGDIVAITDDDAVPRRDWLKRIEAHFLADPKLGGLGGRDWLSEDGRLFNGNSRPVGKVQFFGRLVGNHHLGFGDPREVDFLKGANMSYRREAIGSLRFDESLRGRGAQVSNDMAFSMAVKLTGWKLLYDPAVAIDHFFAPRTGLTERRSVAPEVIYDDAFNKYWAIRRYLRPGWRRFAALLWQSAIGTFAEPGFVRAAFVYLSDRSVVVRWKAARMGRLSAQKMTRNLVCTAGVSGAEAAPSIVANVATAAEKGGVAERSGAVRDS